jgi:toxin ParE1/3/4
MSSRRPKVVFSPTSKIELLSALRYSEREFGVAQRQRYAARLQREITNLLEFPRLGRARPEYGHDARGLLVGEYHVIYRVEGRDIYVVNIIHESRNPFASSAEDS